MRKPNFLHAKQISVQETASLVGATISSKMDRRKTEMTLFLGAADQSDNKKNGYQEREYSLKGVGCIRIRMPVDPKRRFESSVVPAREQIDPRIKEV